MKTGQAVLVLEDGSRFEGISIGASGEQVGEVCFNTSMTGYQEIMSDPSYAGQIVVMTCSQIGNVGINPEDMESSRPWIRGFVVRESARLASNWRQQESLTAFLQRHRIPAIAGIDTRRLVRILREKGAQRGILSTESDHTKQLSAKAHRWPGLQGMDLTGEVSCRRAYSWRSRLWQIGHGYPELADADVRFRVTAIDFGIKRNILRSLAEIGCDIKVLPSTASARQVLASKPDGIFLSNGPGDPDAVQQGLETVTTLLQTRKPLFGICLGHQILSLALGAHTVKMKFGHRGGNHPVQNLLTGSVEVTAQNHGFVVDEATLPETVSVTHRSLFDGSVEGIRHNNDPVFSVQYHPEASPGPHDSHYLFHQFADLMNRQR
ncbi:MAG: glutamine-hydrolyzing carbamoyl-phosphate synthase small subunit [Magnetococcales bacterium]|nr:glutamine-hydrolyzing carbamoyl-phosphate synthase small subunit [Magnetococcales bacterium]